VFDVRTAVLCSLFPILALTATAGGAEDKPRPAQDRPVLVQPVHFESRTPDRSFVAVVRPRIETDLGFRIAGKVSRRLVEVGQSVAAGQELADLDPTDLVLQREQAEAELRAAVSSLTQTAADEKRLSDLKARGWTPDATYDKQRTALAEAQARRDRAERSVVLARNALTYATLRADTDGIVTAVQVEPGQVVAAGTPAIRLARGGEKEAVVAIPENLVGRIREAQATVSLWSRPDTSWPAVLRELAPAADPVSRTYTARFSIPKADDEVKLGMTATVTVMDAAHDRIARLPLSALFSQGAGPGLWVVDPATGSLTLKPVEVAGYTGRQVLVRSGVTEGELVVTLGVQKLDPAVKVRIVQSLGL